jgi:hypothetical protein
MITHPIALGIDLSPTLRRWPVSTSRIFAFATIWVKNQTLSSGSAMFTRRFGEK